MENLFSDPKSEQYIPEYVWDTLNEQARIWLTQNQRYYRADVIRFRAMLDYQIARSGRILLLTVVLIAAIIGVSILTHLG